VIPSHDPSRISRLRPVWRKLPSGRAPDGPDPRLICYKGFSARGQTVIQLRWSKGPTPARDVDLDARRIRNPAISRAFGRGNHCRQEASNPFLTKNGRSSVTLPAPPRSVCGQDCISEHRPQSTACNFSLFEIIGLICEHLAYEVRGHYINCIASQHARTNYALAINRPRPGFDRVVHHGSEQPKRRQSPLRGHYPGWN
jgi:hypothetical protein